MNRLLTIIARVVAVALVLLPAASTPALAASDRLLVSHDGVNFVPEGTFALFTDIARVVPGDRQTEHVWVMNNSASPALLRVDMLHPNADNPDLAQAFSLNVLPAGGSPSAAVTLARGIENGECTVIGAGIRLGEHERLRLDITSDVDAGLINKQGALGVVQFQLRGLLVEAVAGVRDVPGAKCIAPDPDLSRDDLVNTGGAAPIPLIAGATAAILAATALALLTWWRRRHRDEDDAK